MRVAEQAPAEAVGLPRRGDENDPEGKEARTEFGARPGGELHASSPTRGHAPRANLTPSNVAAIPHGINRFGEAPDGSRIFTRDLSTQDSYALDIDLP